jgi:hypothetical protein
VQQGQYGDLFGFLRELVVTVRPQESASGATANSQQAQHRAKLDQIQNRMKGALFSGKTSAFEHLSTYRMVVRGMQLTPKEKCEGFVWSLAPSARNTWEQEVTPWLDSQTAWNDETWARFEARFIEMYEGKANIKAQVKLEETKWQEGQLMIDHCATIKMLAKIGYPDQGETYWVAKVLNSIPHHIAEKVRFKFDYEAITWAQLTKVLAQIGPTEKKLEEEGKSVPKPKQPTQNNSGRSQAQQPKFRPGPPLPPYFRNQQQQQQQQPVRFATNLVQSQEEEEEEEEELELKNEEEQTEALAEKQGWDETGLTPEQTNMMQTFQAFLTGEQQYQQHQPPPGTQYQQQQKGKQQGQGAGHQENRGYRTGNQQGSGANPNWQQNQNWQKSDGRQQNSGRQQNPNWQRQQQQQSGGSFGKPGGNHYSFNLDEEGLKYLKTVLNLGGAPSLPKDKSQDICRKCGEKGHWESDAQCPQSSGDKPSGNGSSSK